MPATPLLHVEAVGAQFLLEHGRALGFVEAQFGRFPDLPGDGAEAVRVGGDVGQNVVGGGGGAGREEKYQNFTHG
jgi:hypothetical protein